MSRKRALITGITGQDGSYLAELLLSKGYEVHGIVRRVAIEDPDHRLKRIRHLLGDLRLHAAALESYASMHAVVEGFPPDECYHLAAQSFVAYSFDDEFSTLNININGTHFLLSAVRRLAPKCRFYFAGSSEMFGAAEVSPQNEGTRFQPRSCYGISKVAGYRAHPQLSRGLRPLRLQRHPVQPRIPPAGIRVRLPQDHFRRFENRGRETVQSAPRKPRRAPRLGPLPRICGGHVAHAATGPP